MISVSLEKRVENVVVNLQKRTTKQLKDVNLNLCLDVSGSTYSEYRSNSAGESSISILLERICAISKVVDDDGILNFYLLIHLLILKNQLLLKKIIKILLLL